VKRGRALERGYSRVRRDDINIKVGEERGEREKGCYMVGVRGENYVGSPSMRGRLYFVYSLGEAVLKETREVAGVDSTRAKEDWDERVSLTEWCMLFEVRANVTFQAQRWDERFKEFEVVVLTKKECVGFPGDWEELVVLVAGEVPERVKVIRTHRIGVKDQGR
jgi:hypothetical protein